MRRLYHRAGVRGIILSGFGRGDDLRQVRAAGFLARLTKAVDFRRLELTIRQVASAAGSPMPNDGSHASK